MMILIAVNFMLVMTRLDDDDDDDDGYCAANSDGDDFTID